MDQSTRSALSGLQWAIDESYQLPKQPDEFSAMDFYEEMRLKDPTYTESKAKYRLKNLQQDQKLSSRFITVGRSNTRIYKVV